jgi:hypothetical protein
MVCTLTRSVSSLEGMCGKDISFFYGRFSTFLLKFGSVSRISLFYSPLTRSNLDSYFPRVWYQLILFVFCFFFMANEANACTFKASYQQEFSINNSFGIDTHTRIENTILHPCNTTDRTIDI